MAKGKYQKWIEPDGLLRLEAWARDGLREEDIAHNIGITRETLRVWKNQFSVISVALKRGKDVADIIVENSLYKRAIGYSYTEVTKERIIDSGQKKRHGGESELTDVEWEFAIKYFGGRCCYCGKSSDKLTKDHVKPLKDNGTLSRDNVIPCCQSCNSSKKDNEMVSWYQSQRCYDEYRLKKISEYIQFVMDIGEHQENTSELIVTKEVTKEVIPDVTAQIFWLKNRKSKEWRDKHELEHSGVINNPYQGLTTEQLIRLAADDT